MGFSGRLFSIDFGDFDVFSFRRLFAVLTMGTLAATTLPALAGDSGDKTVGEICSVCHGSGLMGAPKIGDNYAWQARLQRAGSIDLLAESAEHGRGNMPPRGGEPSLTDNDLKAAIRYMLGKSGITS